MGAPLAGLVGYDLFGEQVFGYTPTGRLQSVTIDGSEYLPYVLRRGFRLNLSSGGSVQTAAFTVIQPIGAAPFSVGDAVEVTDINNVGLYSGYISALAPVKANQQYVLWQVSCQDHMRLLDSVCTGNETFSGQTDQTIIQYLFGEYLPEIDTANVRSTATISFIDLSNLSLRRCMEAISDTTQAIWYLGASKTLYYHEQNYRVAPFGLSESADKISSFGMLRNADIGYRIEFTRPCNKCYIANMTSEDSTSETYAPPATGDDGQIQRVSSSDEYPPAGAYTAETAGNSMVARQKVVNPNTANTTKNIAADGDDGYVTKSGYSYPPGGTATIGTTGYVVVDDSFWSSVGGYDNSYTRSVAVLYFDTSSIPDDATITLAQLNAAVYDYGMYDSAMKVYGEWYDGSNRPISASDWTASWNSTAFVGIYINNFAASLPITLKNPNSYISKTGYTGIRMMMYGGVGAPGGINRLRMLSYTHSSPASLYIEYEWGGTSYTVTCALVRFNTAALPDTAAVSGATLKLKVVGKVDIDDVEVGVEWYAGTNWPIGDADWTNTPSASAYGYVALSSLPAVGSVWSIPLKDAAANVSLDGYTGFRIHIRTPLTSPITAPTGDNYLEISTQETASDPQLVVNYTPGEMVEGDYQDDASIALYGLYEKRVIDSRVVSQTEAEERAEAEVVRYAYPELTLSATILEYGLEVGQYVHVAAASMGLEGDFVIRQLSMATDDTKKREFKYSITAGNYQASLVEFLRKAALT